MELHGGSIQIESNLDCGTRVTIRLPAERILQTT
jgi:signal transduction histidine kinase